MQSKEIKDITEAWISMHESTSVKILLAPTYDLAKTIEKPELTIEAEYGKEVLNGTIYTAAHHDARAHNLAPCIDHKIPKLKSGTIVVSHLDIDSLGGCLIALGKLNKKFPWDTFAKIDVHGAHKIREFIKNENEIKLIYALYAWLKQHRFPYDKISDITDVVLKASDAIDKIVENNQPFIQAGIDMLKDETELNKRTFVSNMNNVIMRKNTSEREFSNHLYTDPSGKSALAVVAYNIVTQSITISLANPIKGINCKDIVQKFWGSEAGGKDVIAGSPRTEKMSEEQWKEISDYLKFILRGSNDPYPRIN